MWQSEYKILSYHQITSNHTNYLRNSQNILLTIKLLFQLWRCLTAERGKSRFAGSSVLTTKGGESCRRSPSRACRRTRSSSSRRSATQLEKGNQLQQQLSGGNIGWFKYRSSEPWMVIWNIGYMKHWLHETLVTWNIGYMKH